MATLELPAEQRLRLSAIPWDAYVLYSDSLGPRRRFWYRKLRIMRFAESCLGLGWPKVFVASTVSGQRSVFSPLRAMPC
jgi:hypothetical protein